MAVPLTKNSHAQRIMLPLCDSQKIMVLLAIENLGGAIAADIHASVDIPSMSTTCSKLKSLRTHHYIRTQGGTYRKGGAYRSSYCMDEDSDYYWAMLEVTPALYAFGRAEYGPSSNGSEDPGVVAETTRELLSLLCKNPAEFEKLKKAVCLFTRESFLGGCQAILSGITDNKSIGQHVGVREWCNALSNTENKHTKLISADMGSHMYSINRHEEKVHEVIRSLEHAHALLPDQKSKLRYSSG